MTLTLLNIFAPFNPGVRRPAGAGCLSSPHRFRVEPHVRLAVAAFAAVDPTSLVVKAHHVRHARLSQNLRPDLGQVPDVVGYKLILLCYCRLPASFAPVHGRISGSARGR
jgi:hypothetical protein